MNLKAKLTAVMVLISLGLGVYIYASYASIEFNNVQLEDLKQTQLRGLLLSRESLINFEIFEKNVEVAISLSEFQIIEDDEERIKNIVTLLDQLVSVFPEKSKEVSDLVTDVGAFYVDVQRFVKMGIAGGYEQEAYLNLGKAVSEKREDLKKRLLQIEEQAENRFFGNLEGIRVYNNKRSFWHPLYAGLAGVVIFGFVLYVLISLTRRILYLKNHLEAVNWDRIEPIQLTRQSDEIGALYHSINEMFDRLGEARRQLVHKDFVESILLAIEDMLFLLDEHGHVRHISVVTSNILGYSFDDIRGHFIGDIMAFDDDDRLLLKNAFVVDMISSKSGFQGHAKLKSVNGRVIPVAMTASIMRNEQGQFDGFVCLAKDITYLREIEQEKDSMQVQLFHASRLASIGTLGAGVAHELNNPLTGILGYAEIIEQSLQDVSTDHWPLKPRMMEMFSRVFKLVERMEGIINHLRNYSRAGMGAEEKVPLDINRPIRDSFILLNAQLSDHDIEVKFELEEELPLMVGQSNELESVFQNLITNSRDAFAGIKDNRRKFISMKSSYDEKGQSLCILYEDNAGGMSQDTINNLFTHFLPPRKSGVGQDWGCLLRTILSANMREPSWSTLRMEQEQSLQLSFLSLIRLQVTPILPFANWPEIDRKFTILTNSGTQSEKLIQSYLLTCGCK